MTTETEAPTRTTWKIDAGHSLVEFSNTYLGITTIKGRFTQFDGTIQMDPNDWSRSSVEVHIDARSYDSANARRVEKLGGAGFLELETYPIITFRSTSVESLGLNNLRVTGDLTLHDVTRPVVLQATYNGQATSPRGEAVAFSAEATLRVRDFGIATDVPAFVVGETARVELQIHAAA